MSTFRDRPTALGVATAAVIGGALAAIGLPSPGDLSSPLAYILPLSLPVGVALAWRHGRAVVASPRFPAGRVLLMTLQALVVGALLVGMVSVLVPDVYTIGAADGIWGGIGKAFSVALLGIVFFGIPMLAIIAPIVTVWAVVVRRLHRERP